MRVKIIIIISRRGGIMKKVLILVLGVLLCTGASSVMALPFLQLYISDAVYDTSTETVVSTSSSFTLYALIDPGSNEYVQGQTYYISAAIAPQIDTAMDLGSFNFDTTLVDVTDDMIYGTAPIEEIAGNLDLPGHGIFPTYFTEFSFTIDGSNMVAAYNVQDDPGGFGSSSSSDFLYYAAFVVDVSGLDPDYVVHFDLYTKADGKIDKFAPFSHDAESAPVPEPATLLLLGSGLIGTGLITKRKI
jgi:hypothetical protein